MIVDGSIVDVSASGFRFFEVEAAVVSVGLDGFDLGSVPFCYRLRLRLSIGVKVIPRRT
jgi:hypothetical protein